MRRGLANTIKLLSQASAGQTRPGAGNRGVLREVSGFGPNPGRLAMLTYEPAELGPKAPLVVVLHGCTQSAEGYARGAGWIEAADRYGFVLLCPEQSSSNNPNLCFNWFVSEDIRRGGGEAASIAQMITHMIATHELNARRVYITGLSAGGAMANVMLATYPELFRAGAIIAGLPYASAENVQEAFSAMAHRRDASDLVLGERVRAAGGSYAGPWPSISVWHGDRDMTVSPGAGEAVARQWVNVHNAAPALPTVASRGGHRTWTDAKGQVVVDHYTIQGMGHGVPLETQGADAVGMAGPYLLDVGVSSTLEIIARWGLAPVQVRAQAPLPKPKLARAKVTMARPSPSAKPSPIDVGAVINNALRAAGLLKK